MIIVDRLCCKDNKLYKLTIKTIKLYQQMDLLQNNIKCMLNRHLSNIITCLQWHFRFSNKYYKPKATLHVLYNEYDTTYFGTFYCTQYIATMLADVTLICQLVALCQLQWSPSSITVELLQHNIKYFMLLSHTISWIHSKNTVYLLNIISAIEHLHHKLCKTINSFSLFKLQSKLSHFC